MTTKIEIFYSYQSPYSYLALEKCYDLERDFDVEILWQPFSAKASGQTLPPTPIMPDKLTYLFEDTKRYAQEMHLELTYPEGWPETEFDPGKVTRGALVAADMGVLMEYNYKVFQKMWGAGEDPNTDEFTNQLCQDLDIDLGEFLSKMNSSDTRERVKGIYKRGRKLGVFDTPTFLIDKERVFGLDKLPYLRERLAKIKE